MRMYKKNVLRLSILICLTCLKIQARGYKVHASIFMESKICPNELTFC